MLFTGTLSNTAQASVPLTDTARLRLSNLGVVLAVAEISTMAPISQNNPLPLPARVLALAPTAANNQQQRVEVEVNGQSLWVKMLQTPLPGEQIQLRFTDAATLDKLQQQLQTPATGMHTGTAQATEHTAATLPTTGAASAPNAAAIEPNGEQSTTHLSAFGNLVNQLLSRIDEHTGTPPQLTSLVPPASRESVHSALPPHLVSEHLADGMHKAVEKSGVFYESHLNSWAHNERSIEQIRQEPQARLSQPATTATTHDSAAATPSATPATADYTPPEKLLPILREQMQVLEQRQFTAQLEVWPKQMAQLTIADEGAQQNNSAASEQPQWRAQLKLHLPHLGVVDANVQIQGQEVRLNLRTGETVSAEQLRHHALDLQQALQTSGLQLTQFKVEA